MLVRVEFVFSHTKNGPAPYLVLGQVAPGQSIGRPQRKTGLMPEADAPEWRMLPVLPANGLQCGIRDDVVHFSPVLPYGIISSKPAALVYGVMTWVFYAAKGATLFSIEKTASADNWLNVFTSDPDDWKALNALHERLVKSADIEQDVQDLCDEVRP